MAKDSWSEPGGWATDDSKVTGDRVGFLCPATQPWKRTREAERKGKRKSLCGKSGGGSLGRGHRASREPRGGFRMTDKASGNQMYGLAPPPFYPQFPETQQKKLKTAPEVVWEPGRDRETYSCWGSGDSPLPQFPYLRTGLVVRSWGWVGSASSSFCISSFGDKPGEMARPTGRRRWLAASMLASAVDSRQHRAKCHLPAGPFAHTSVQSSTWPSTPLNIY